jgi:thiol-disulfide isomerase/thioredoxin
VRVVACTVLLALCLGVTGCRLFGKKSPTAANPADHTAPPAADIVPPQPSPANTAGAGAPAGVDGLLAGRVLDSYGSKPPLTSIRVVALDEGKDGAAAPIEYRTDDQGYFTIFALQPGKHYKLVARAKDGDRLLAGISYVTPPDPKVLIRISEDFASSTTPPPPPDPAWPGTQPNGGNDGNKPAPKRPAADLGVPKPNTGASSTQPATTMPADPSRIVDEGSALARNQQSPRVEIPSGPRIGIAAPAISPSTIRVPSCSVAPDGGLTFALNDLDGRPWEFPARPHGRVVLLDFWGTWCGYCVRAVPELIDLQQQYGSWGLDVIGIAYEQDGTPEEQARRIKAFRDRNRVNYHLLLGGGMDSCPLKKHLGVESFPTLILLDEKGHVLQRYQGLTAAARRDLEYKIRWYLNVGR